MRGRDRRKWSVMRKEREDRVKLQLTRTVIFLDSKVGAENNG